MRTWITLLLFPDLVPFLGSAFALLSPVPCMAEKAADIKQALQIADAEAMKAAKTATPEKRRIGIPGTELAVKHESQGKPDCYEYGDYVIVTRATPQSVGEDMLVVKRKRGQEIGALCGIGESQADLVVRNRDADWFFGLWKRFLFIDSGTGPGIRGLSIMDVEAHKRVYEALYLDDDSIKLSSTGDLVFWIEDEPATAENCTDFAQHQKDIMSSAIVAKVKLNLFTLRAEKRGERRCIPQM
ncbi:MAG: hypothetical protein V1798_04965 [Pseudomonadota bacterium]